jgi:hypothetical protein
MQVNILKKVVSDRGNIYITAQCNKKTVSVSILPGAASFSINVCTHNAMHKAWGMTLVGGKWFASFNDAIEAYKSPELKAILNTVQYINEGELA